MYRNVYILYVWYIYTLQTHMSAICIAIHYIGWGHSHSPQEIHCLEWELCVRFAHVFQEGNPGVKWDMSVYAVCLSTLSITAEGCINICWNLIAYSCETYSIRTCKVHIFIYIQSNFILLEVGVKNVFLIFAYFLFFSSCK